MPVDQIPATTPGWTGIDVLARKPDAQVMAVLDLVREDAAAMFPGFAVVGYTGIPKPDMLKGRAVVIWPAADEGERLAESLVGTAAKVVLISREHHFLAFQRNPRQALAYARANMRRFEVNGHDPATPQPPQAAVEPVARPVASVTPITEARTRQQAKTEDEPVEYAEFAEDALASGFSDRHPELRYVARWGKWMAWSDTDGWQEDNTLKVFDLARAYCRAAANGQPNAALSSRRKVKSAATRASVENLARADRRHALTAEVWDTDKLALNTPGGLIDLRDGSMRPVRPDDYCRKRTAATPGGDCPQWMEFLAQCTDGDVPMQDYLARLAGMCCTGDTREDFLGFIYGPGGNGKSVFIDTIQNILGTYAINAGIETFTEQKSDKHTTELARLYGSRLVVAQETEQGRRWAESRLKLLTGGGKVTARFMRCDDFEFTPELKLVIVGNHKPSLRNVDAAFRRRFHLIPFVHVPSVIDRTLRQKLWAERNGILLWMIAGCADWLSNGLQAPESIRKATEEYFDTQDIIGQWINDMCDTGNGCESTIRSLFTSYRAYCEGLHEFALRQGELRDALLCRPGISQGGYAKSPTIKGLRVRVDTTAQSSRYQD